MNIYIYIYIYTYIYMHIYNFYTFILKCQTIIFSKRHFLKKQLYFGLFNNLKTALTKSLKTITKLNNSKTIKEQLKVE